MPNSTITEAAATQKEIGSAGDRWEPRLFRRPVRFRRCRHGGPAGQLVHWIPSLWGRRAAKQRIYLNRRPKLPAGSQITSVTFNGRAVEFHMKELNSAVEVSLRIPHREGKAEVSIHHQNGVDFRIVDDGLHSAQLSRRVRLLDMAFVEWCWNLELEGIDDEEYIVEFHSSRPPREIDNGRLVRRLGSVYRVASKSPPSVKSARSNFRRWKLSVSWPRSQVDQ